MSHSEFVTVSEQSALAAHCEPRTEKEMFGIRTSDRKQHMKIFIYYSRIFKFVFRILMKIYYFLHFDSTINFEKKEQISMQLYIWLQHWHKIETVIQHEYIHDVFTRLAYWPFTKL